MSEVETIVLKKPKKPRSEAQLAATAKLVASNKAKREAKALAASGGKAPEKVPEPKKVSEDKPIEPVIKKAKKTTSQESTPSPTTS